MTWLLQQFEPGSTDQNEANEWFYSLFIWGIVLVPTIIVIALAAINKKKKPGLPHVTDMTWTLDVVEAELPVLIHAYHKWSIGDRVIEAQVEKIAELEQGRLAVFWLDIEANPAIVGEYPTLGEKSIALFVDNRLVWQAQGVHDAESVLAEVRPLLPARSEPAGEDGGP